MRRKAGIKTRSINLALGVVRHILNLAASEWLDDAGLTWLEHPPKIKLLKVTDARKPYPLSWDEQTRLFRELPDHLARMALFKVNTGCREQEVCSLRWEWEIEVPELDTPVFLIPEERVKNGEERQDLFGHRSGRITSHYSAAEPGNLIEAANQVVGQGPRQSPALVVLKKQAASARALTA